MSFLSGKCRFLADPDACSPGAYSVLPFKWWLTCSLDILDINYAACHSYQSVPFLSLYWCEAINHHYFLLN